MKYLRCLSVAFVSQTLLFNPCLSQENRMTSFQWILGKWQSSTNDRKLIETWKFTDDSTLSGQSYFIKADGDSVITENIQLAFRNGRYYYIPTTSNQNNRQPVLFEISVINNSGFTAENKLHDFPQRIIYNLKNKDVLLAVVDGTIKNAYRKEEFQFSRF